MRPVLAGLCALGVVVAVAATASAQYYEAEFYRESGHPGREGFGPDGNDEYARRGSPGPGDYRPGDPREWYPVGPGAGRYPRDFEDRMASPYPFDPRFRERDRLPNCRLINQMWQRPMPVHWHYCPEEGWLAY